MSYQLYVTGGHGFTEAILPTLLHPSNAVDIVRDYFTRGYQGQHIDLPPDTDVSQASNLTDTQKQTLLDGLQEGHLVLSSRYEPGFALFSESRASPDTLRNDLPATLRQRLQRQWPGTSRGGAVLRSDSLAPAEEPASNSTEPLAPESPAPGTGPYHVTLAYRWPDGTGVADLPFTLGTDKDGIEGTLDQNGEARIEGLNGRFASVRLSSDASDDDVGHQRRGIQASLKELLKHEQKEADALAREYQQMPWHQRSAVSAGAILQGIADAGIGLLRFVDSMADLASPSQTLMDGLKSAWSASEGSSDTVWHESFQANYDEARHRRWVKALGFDPGDLSRKDIAEAYDLASLVMADPILRESLNDFIAEYASIQHHTEVSYVAGAVAFDLVLIALLAVATGGIGAAGAAGGQIRHTGLLRHLGKLIKGYGKAVRKQRLRRLWRDTDLKKQNHLEDTAPKRVEGLKLKPISDKIRYVNMPNDLVSDPRGVYGYLPTKESQFHPSKWPVDWTNVDQVSKVRTTRLEYHAGLEKKQQFVDMLRSEGVSEHDIARKLVEMRNQDRLSHYKTPEALKVVYQRNIDKYGNRTGPTFESQLAKYGNTTEVINAALRSNDTMDILTGIAKPKGSL